MNIKNKETILILGIGILWIFVVMSGWVGQWQFGLLSGVLLMYLHMILGSAQNGVVGTRLLLYSLTAWLVLWLVGFLLTQRYAQMFLNQEPTFSILGFHPSFAFIILLYWIGGVLTLNIGFIRYAEEWLSDEKWDAFVEKIGNIDSKEALA